MRNFFLAVTAFLIWSFFAFWYFTSMSVLKQNTYFMDSEKNLSEVQEDSVYLFNEIEETLRQYSMLLDSISHYDIEKNGHVAKVFDENKNILFSLDSVYFKQSSDEIHFNKPTEYSLKVISAYMKKHPEMELIIMCDYSASEIFSNPNIGIKRGEYLKDQLAKLGVNRHRITTKSSIKELKFDAEMIHQGGISFYVQPMSEERIKEVEDKQTISLRVYPTFTFNSIIINEDLEKSAEELKTLLATYPEKKIMIIGHTDNVGSQIDTHETGLLYAKQVSHYLIEKHNFPPYKITALSKGKLQPITDNSSSRGRALNKRIEIIIE